jgi:hypothetical protein
MNNELLYLNGSPFHAPGTRVFEEPDGTLIYERPHVVAAQYDDAGWKDYGDTPANAGGQIADLSPRALGFASENVQDSIAGGKFRGLNDSRPERSR